MREINSRKLRNYSQKNENMKKNYVLGIHNRTNNGNTHIEDVFFLLVTVLLL